MNAASSPVNANPFAANPRNAIGGPTANMFPMNMNQNMNMNMNMQNKPNGNTQGGMFPAKVMNNNMNNNNMNNNNMQAQGGAGICKFFRTTGSCRSGNNCKFSHEMGNNNNNNNNNNSNGGNGNFNGQDRGQSQGRDKRAICHFFKKNGQCRNGDSCKHSHDLTGSGGWGDGMEVRSFIFMQHRLSISYPLSS